MYVCVCFAVSCKCDLHCILFHHLFPKVMMIGFVTHMVVYQQLHGRNYCCLDADHFVVDDVVVGCFLKPALLENHTWPFASAKQIRSLTNA